MKKFAELILVAIILTAGLTTLFAESKVEHSEKRTEEQRRSRTVKNSNKDKHKNPKATNVKEQIDPKYALNQTPDSNQPGGIYIPKDINDCFVELKRMLDPKFVKEIKESSEKDIIKYHMGLGMWIRNNWGLWGGSRLQDYFIELGFRHPDDISGAIVNSFWRHLNGMPIDITKEAEASKYYWQIREEPNNPLCPEHNVPIKIKYKLEGSIIKEGKALPICIHVGCCTKTNEIWIYEFGKGWRQPEGNIRKRVNELEAKGTAGLISAPIEKP
jgi:hypothetical protein